MVWRTCVPNTGNLVMNCDWDPLNDAKLVKKGHSYLLEERKFIKSRICEQLFCNRRLALPFELLSHISKIVLPDKRRLTATLMSGQSIFVWELVWELL